MSGKITGSILSPGGTINGQATNAQPITGGVAASAAVSGNVARDAGLSGSVAHEAALQGDLQGESAMVGNMASAYEAKVATYEGDYEVTPKVDAQELNTKHKYMKEDVTVCAIPFFVVGNTSGGNTVYIADEIE